MRYQRVPDYERTQRMLRFSKLPGEGGLSVHVCLPRRTLYLLRSFVGATGLKHCPQVLCVLVFHLSPDGSNVVNGHLMGESVTG